MLQQTRISTVIPYYRRFMQRFPSVASLAAADLQEVLKVWEGLGYYARARNLHRAAQRITAEHGGRIPSEPEALHALPGIGSYIGAAIASIAFEKPAAAVDGNVKRVLSRLFAITAPVNHMDSMPVFERRAKRLLDTKHPGDFNQGLMELGERICRPKNPTCLSCPLQFCCRAFASHQTDRYPVRIQRPATPVYAVAIGVVFKKGRVLILQRKEEGFLGGLWEFPGGKIKKGESPEKACIREMKEETMLNIGIKEHLIRIRHGYTHFKIVADIFICRHLSGRVRLAGASAFKWVRVRELDEYPFPGANRKFIPILKKFASA